MDIKKFIDFLKRSFADKKPFMSGKFIIQEAESAEFRSEINQLLKQYVDDEKGNAFEDDEWNILTLKGITCKPELINLLLGLNDSVAVNFIFLDVSKGKKCLDQPVNKPGTIRKHGTNYTDVKHLLKRIVALIKGCDKKASFTHKTKQLKYSNPVVGILATFDDELEDCSEINILDHIETNLKPNKNFRGLEFWGYSGNKLIPINYNDKQKSDKIAKDLHIMINEKLMSDQIKIPLPWVCLDLRLHNEEKICFSLEEINNFSKEIMPAGHMIKLTEFLKFYSSFGALLYFDKEGLNKHVITNPQLICDYIEKFVTLEFADERVMKIGSLDQFRKKGILQSTLLQTFLEETKLINQGIDEKYFLSLLLHLKICSPLCENSNSWEDDIYFMPIVLPPYKWSDKQECVHKKILGEMKHYETKDSFEVKPLVISFCVDFIPRGMFCLLVTELIKRNPKWKLHPENDVSTYQFNNLATFRMSDGSHYLSLHNKIFYLQVYVRKKNSKPSLCSAFLEAQKAVTSSLKSISNSFDERFHTSNMRYGFSCTCKEPPFFHVSYIEVSECKYATLADCGTTHMSLTKEHKIWFFDSVKVCMHTQDLDTTSYRCVFQYHRKWIH